MNRNYERESSEKFGLLVAFVASAAIFTGGLYVVLKKAAQMAAVQTKEQVKPAQTALPAPTAQALASESKAPQSAATSTGPTVYRCTINGAVIYSDEICKGAKLVDVRPASSGFVAERPRATVRVAAPASETLSVPSVASTSAIEKATREARCALIEAEIERIDGLARQGQSAASQDTLRERRRKLVDEKYSLKC